jgi:hypothetical protein
MADYRCMGFSGFGPVESPAGFTSAQRMYARVMHPPQRPGAARTISRQPELVRALSCQNNCRKHHHELNQFWHESRCWNHRWRSTEARRARCTVRRARARAAQYASHSLSVSAP